MVTKKDIIYTPNGETRTLHIYLPNDYFDTEERYPVMYFFDGHNLFFNEDATYGKSWGMREFLDQWEKKIIMVGIECSHKGNNRLAEYCPYHIQNDFYGNLEGIGAQTMDWIVNVIKPMIDTEYRTWQHREATAIGGSSMGGLMALYAAIAWNKVFSKAACISSAIYSCDTMLHTEISATAISPDTRVYLSWGEKEAYMRNHNHMMCDHLQDCGAVCRTYEQPGGGHCEADWEKQVEHFMHFLWLDPSTSGYVIEQTEVYNY